MTSRQKTLMRSYPLKISLKICVRTGNPMAGSRLMKGLLMMRRSNQLRSKTNQMRSNLQTRRSIQLPILLLPMSPKTNQLRPNPLLPMSRIKRRQKLLLLMMRMMSMNGLIMTWTKKEKTNKLSHKLGLVMQLLLPTSHWTNVSTQRILNVFFSV